MDNQQDPAVAQRALLSVLWWPGWEGSLGEEWIHVCVCGWVPSLSTWNYHNIGYIPQYKIRDFFSNKNSKKQKIIFAIYMIKTDSHKNHQCVSLRGNFDEEQGICTVFKLSPHKLLISYEMVEGGHSGDTQWHIGQFLDWWSKLSPLMRNRWTSCASRYWDPGKDWGVECSVLQK